MPAFSIRSAQAADGGLILGLLRELAAYEKLLDRFTTDEAAIARDFFGPRKLAECDLGFADGEAVGIATYYWTYGSFAAARGLFVEDIFVRPAFRAHGYGKALFRNLAARAMEAGAVKLEWLVLDWNETAMEFYKKIGAHPVDDWRIFRLKGNALEALADR
jgi:GNAT superfamily N-acetyltransferase